MTRIARTTLALVAAILCGCSSKSPNAADSGADSASGDSRRDVAATSDGLNCQNVKIKDGDSLATSPDLTAVGRRQVLNYRFNGENRPYLLHLPTGYDGSRPLPLIVALHGGGTDAATFYNRLSRLVVRANNDKLVLVFPQGVWGVFNGGGCCYPAVQCDLDDTGYIRELVAFLRGALNVDKARIYAMGYSNGAYLSHRLGAELSETFAAVAVGAGSIGGNYPGEPLVRISAQAPIPVIMHHGDQDTAVVFAGGTTKRTTGPEAGRYVVSFADSVKYWVTNNGCNATPTLTQSAKVAVRSFGQCTGGADVVAMVIQGHGHSWPSVTDAGGFDVIGAILDFFKKHPKTP